MFVSGVIILIFHNKFLVRHCLDSFENFQMNPNNLLSRFEGLHKEYLYKPLSLVVRRMGQKMFGKADYAILLHWLPQWVLKGVTR